VWKLKLARTQHTSIHKRFHFKPCRKLFALAKNWKVKSERVAVEEKVKLLTGNFQSEMNYFEVSSQGGEKGVLWKGGCW